MSDVSERLEQQAELLFNNVSGWERNALRRIGKRVKEMKALSYADIQAINNAAIVKKDLKAIIKELSKLTGQSVKEIEKIYAEMIEQQHENNKALYDYRNKKFIPFKDNRQLKSIVRAYARTTAETMVNLSMTKARRLGFVDKNNRFVPLEKNFKTVLDKAVMSITTGTGDLNSEMRQTLKELGGSGLRVDYGGGVTRRLDTMVRQNLLWGAKQVSVEYNEMVGEELGCDGIEIDWHSNPRPSHEFMQGKQYSLNGKRTVNGVTYESADKALDALEEYGCLHFKTPIILGVSEPVYSSKELKRLNEKNAKLITIDGITKSGYEWKQTMRRLETQARKNYGQIDILKAEGDNIGVHQLEDNIKAIEEKYEQISKATGIKAQYEKMSVVTLKNVDTTYGMGYNITVEREQFDRYKNVLKELAPQSFEEFLKIKDAHTIEWNDLKQKYRIVNQYKVDSGEVSVQTILDMDKTIIFEKRKNFPSKYKASGNIAGAYIDTEKTLFLAHSKINDTTSKGYKNYKGTSKIVLLKDERTFKYVDVLMPDGSMREDTFYDTEAKLFEELHLLLQTKEFGEITMLSERGMCESCKGVMEQFKRAHPNIKINVVSNKKVNSNVWKYRMRK